MPRNRKPQRIKKSDYDRVLVTETLPDETPIIFSNEGLYLNVSRRKGRSSIQSKILDRLILAEGSTVKATKPLKYKIRKTSNEYRQLCLLHPIAQIQIRNFYRRYEKLILHYCMRSPLSIRAPKAVAGTFYRKASWENIYKYKDAKITESRVDPFTRYSPSFFAYSGYDRLYKFFNSPDFVELEKKFDLWWSLDVAKCFDSIYTHCLSWALKDKPFTKRHVEISSTFAQAFDILMQRANQNETHGIAIGPEVSRVFAELIFQTVDQRVVAQLKANGWNLGDRYSIRRYVDDVYIFAKAPADAQAVFNCYAEHLLSFNLHVNTAKGDKVSRPFITKKSRLIREANEAANNFIDQFLVQGAEHSLKPTRVYRLWPLTRKFLHQVRSICSYNAVGYEEVSSYLISVFSERVKKVVNVTNESRSDEELQLYRDAVLILLDVMFFLYSVSPSVGASYKLCTSIVVLIRFSRQHLYSYQDAVNHRIYELTENFLANDERAKANYVDGFISLEAINLILAVRELGEHYLLSEKLLAKLFSNKRDFSYFGIISCLFYIRGHDQYRNIRKQLIQAVDGFFCDMREIEGNTEMTCLFLDLVSCPYIQDQRKSKWINRLYSALRLAPPSTPEIASFLKFSQSSHWFVDWKELDLLTSLERKELKRVY